MKTQIENLIKNALCSLQSQGILASDLHTSIVVDTTRDKQFGDYACNIAMVLAKQAKKPPRELAQQIIAAISSSPVISKIEIAGPGFINFYLSPTALHTVIGQILEQGKEYGKSQAGADHKVHIEYVSANPTGPLHVGHGRGAAFGAACTALMRTVGMQVHCEYYVNDAGRQMNILATSVWLRYLALCGEKITFPSSGYKGDYVLEIAQQLKQEHGDTFHKQAQDVFANLPADETEAGIGDKEAHIDALIERAQQLLGEKNYTLVFDLGLNSILDDIRDDLADFGVIYDQWFSERSLFQNDFIYNTIERLKSLGHTYEQDGNLWFKATAFGDDKDRVLIRKNKIPTYFATDISYHLSKFERGYNLVIDVLGADHHGYTPRIHAAMQALGYPAEKIQALFVQFAILYRGETRVQMSTRSGSFVTLRELREEVGNDAARFFYVMRKNEQHLDFDLELAKSHSNDNPVYYIQYAHARIASVQRQLKEKNLEANPALGLEHINRLVEPQEKHLIEALSKYSEVILAAGFNYEPHLLCHYLKDLAHAFHSYYNAHQFLVEDAILLNARLALIAATKQVLQNGLDLLGVKAPEVM